MAIPEGHSTISIVVSDATKTAIADSAAERGMSVSAMLSAWLAAGVDGPLVRAGKTHAVRGYKDELMLSLPRDWIRRTGVDRLDRVSVSYSDDSLVIRPIKS